MTLTPCRDCGKPTRAVPVEPYPLCHRCIASVHHPYEPGDCPIKPTPARLPATGRRGAELSLDRTGEIIGATRYSARRIETKALLRMWWRAGRADLRPVFDDHGIDAGFDDVCSGVIFFQLGSKL